MELLRPLGQCEFPASTVSFSENATQSAKWNAGPQGVMVWSDQPCYVEVGENAEATTESTPIPANSPIPFAVPDTISGQWCVSAIRITDSGTLYCKPINKR